MFDEKLAVSVADCIVDLNWQIISVHITQKSFSRNPFRLFEQCPVKFIGDRRFGSIHI